ncbi:MAG TPA: hypothetical protein DEG93_01445, partial [Gammaproteobacteria bacterium]|nr:hypothetical protein [Gammaproteobacteria bacterium]
MFIFSREKFSEDYLNLVYFALITIYYTIGWLNIFPEEETMKATIKFVVALLPFAMAIPIIANAQENFPRTALGKPDFN